jgi:hypothetical protein
MPNVAALLPQNQAKMSKNTFLYVRMSMTQRGQKQPVSREKTGVSEAKSRCGEMADATELKSVEL